MVENKASVKTILVVDDEENFKDALEFMLVLEGYHVLKASSGHNALKILQDNKVDVILSDIRMPDGDGVELLDKVKANHLTAPILLMMTGFAELSLEEAFNKGAEGMFLKPIDTKSLKAVIDRLLTQTEDKWSHSADEVSVEMKVSLQFSDLSNALQAKVVSLGRGGMFVAIEPGDFPKVNSSVDFKILPANGVPLLEGSGVVRWARPKGTPKHPAGCGIEFVYLPEAHRKNILAIIESKNPRAYIPNE